MIECKNLSKQFVTKTTTVNAVSNVSFIAPDGSVTGLLGPNGAGKTTTLRMLSTLVVPSTGVGLVDGIDVQQQPLVARDRLAALSDARGLYTRLTARENIRYYADLRGVSDTDYKRRLDNLVQLLDMGTIIDRRTDGFSQGERMKTAIARALIHDPQNVILDEPTNGLDVMTTRALREVIIALRERGKCVVFSSHVMQEVGALCDRIVIISRGKIVAEGTAADLKQIAGRDTLEEAFVQIVEQEASHG